MCWVREISSPNCQALWGTVRRGLEGTRGLSSGLSPFHRLVLVHWRGSEGLRQNLVIMRWGSQSQGDSQDSGRCWELQGATLDSLAGWLMSPPWELGFSLTHKAKAHLHMTHIWPYADTHQHTDNKSKIHRYAYLLHPSRLCSLSHTNTHNVCAIWYQVKPWGLQNGSKRACYHLLQGQI